MEPSNPKARPPVPAILSPTAGALQNPALALTLGRLGFDPAARPATAPVSPASETLGERRRNWILEVMENQRSLSPRTGGVRRERDLSGERFLDDYYAPGRPVVIAGAIDDWPALRRWTPDYLRRTVGKAPVEYQSGRDTNPDFELHKDLHTQSGPFDAFIDRIGRGGNDVYLTAYNSSANRKALEVLDADLGPLHAYLTPGPGMIWIGPAGTFTPLHFDLTNNLIAQVVGRKTLVLVPPSESAKMYNRRHVFSEVHDLTAPGRLALYPLARAVRRFEIELAAGEMLYVPVGWWHQVRALDFSVTLTFTNFRWPNDVHGSFPPD